MISADKPSVRLHGKAKTPPFSKAGRLEAGFLFCRLQSGEKHALPWSRPMPSIGSRCDELRINDENINWRIIYRIDADAIIILDVFRKQTQRTPQEVTERCKKRIQMYDSF